MDASAAVIDFSCRSADVICGTSVEYVLLAYGTAFVATGFALGVQARAATPELPVPRAALWALTAFALVHGAGEWVQLAVYLEQRDHGALVARLALVRLALLAASFAVLGAFGLLLGARRGRRTHRLLAAAAPAAALAGWALALGVALSRRTGPPDADALAASEAATRYLLGVPACALAIAGLDRTRRRLRSEEWRAARYVAAASVAVVAYGFFTGLVVPEASLGAARTLNLASFAAVTHAPVELFRAASIAAVGLLVSEVFVRSTAEHLRAEVEHLRDEFISLVAHDLRTPLGTIDTGAALLERLPAGEHASEREQRVLRAIRASVRAMSKIVSDLLDATRLGSKRLSVSPERVDLEPLLLRLVEWAPAETMRGHVVRLVVSHGPLPPVLADPVRVEQVLANLLSNAGKYSAPGSEIVLHALTGRDDVTLSVTNAGAGIPPADLPRIFARNYRTTSARRGGKPGLGLGLYIARGLVEAQGGRIWVESELGQRTTFSFTLPRAPEARVERGAVADEGGGRGAAWEEPSQDATAK